MSEVPLYISSIWACQFGDPRLFPAPKSTDLHREPSLSTCRHPTPYTLHSTLDTVHRTPYTLLSPRVCIANPECQLKNSATRGPSWGYPNVVLGAILSFFEPFLLQKFWKPCTLFPIVTLQTEASNLGRKDQAARRSKVARFVHLYHTLFRCLSHTG